MIPTGLLPKSLSTPGEHLVRRAIRAQDDQFAVPLVRDEGAAVQEEAAEVDPSGRSSRPRWRRGGFGLDTEISLSSWRP